MRAISMIDILNVDSSPMPSTFPQDDYTEINQDTSKTKGNMQDSSNEKNSASPYYSDIDKHKDSSTGTAADDACNTQPSHQEPENPEDYEESVPGVQNSRNESSSTAHLHTTNNHAPDGASVYGIDSASSCLNTTGMSTSDGQYRDVQVIVLQREPDASDELYSNA